MLAGNIMPPSAPRAAAAASAFWPLCTPRSARHAGEVDQLLLHLAGVEAQLRAGEMIAVVVVLGGRERVAVAPLLDALGDGAAALVVDADAGLLGLDDQPLLDRGVVLHRAVAVEVVGRDVEQHADGRLQRRRQVDLERRQLDHVERGRTAADRAPGSACRCCRPSARRGRRPSADARSAPWSSTCRWCR